VPTHKFVIQSAEDRRVNLRQVIRGTAVTIETTSGDSFIAELVDVSRSGIRFLLSKDILCGSEIIVRPPSSSELRPIRARIMRQRIIDTPYGTVLECGAKYSDEAELRRHTWWIAMRKAA
jgi:hypothetical protein